MWRVRLAALGLVTLSSGCLTDRCLDYAQARGECLDEASAAGVDVSGYDTDESCEGYRAADILGPIVGAIVRASAPDFKCRRDVWNDAECTSQAGIDQALTDEVACEDDE